MTDIKSAREGGYTTGIRKDGEPGKRFPNSASAMIRATAKYWLHATEPEKFADNLSSERFVELSNFREIFDRASERFPGKDRKRKITKHGKMIDTMGRGNDSDFEYYRLRAFSDFIQVSEAVFLFFMRCMSVERRIDDPDKRKLALQQHVEAMKRVVNLADELVGEQGASGNLFSHVDNKDKIGNDIWIADIGTMKRFSNAYNDGDTSALQEAIDID